MFCIIPKDIKDYISFNTQIKVFLLCIRPDLKSKRNKGREKKEQ